MLYTCIHCGYRTAERFCPVCGEVIEDYQLFPAPEINLQQEMTGEEFEDLCARILEKNGFTGVKKTRKSGDHGVDLLAEKDDISYAIQCKHYTSTVGNAAVQEAYTGKMLYGKDVAVVMTDSFFSDQARMEANALKVKLWDRQKILQMI